MPRDLRDPQKLGQRILDYSKGGGGYPPQSATNAYDANRSKMDQVPDYDHGESLTTFTVRQYREELERAAEAGDRHAADTLKGIPNDDPSGD